MQDSKEKALPSYCTRLKAERARDLYVRILNLLTEDNRYRNPDYDSRSVAKDLETNSRYISAAVLLSTGNNFRALVNGLRLRDACKMLRSPRFAEVTAEEIGLLVGFAKRQSFYLAFRRTMNCTPKEYRQKYMRTEEDEVGQFF